METLLGLPPMNNNDALASLIGSEFTGPGDQKPFTADTVNRDNGLIYTANTKTAVGAKESAKMDFTHEDHAPVQKLNVILWKDAMGMLRCPRSCWRSRKRRRRMMMTIRIVCCRTAPLRVGRLLRDLCRASRGAPDGRGECYAK